MESRDWIDVSQAIVGGLGLGLVWWQLKKRADAENKTHAWNRRKSAQDACNDFVDPKVFEHWQRIYKPVIEGKKPYDELTDIEKSSVHTLLSFFESLAILLRHNIVDETIIYDHFGTVWPPLSNCCQQFIISTRANRSSDARVFEHFLFIGKQFAAKTASLDYKDARLTESCRDYQAKVENKMRRTP